MSETGAGGWVGFAYAIFAVIGALFGTIILVAGIVGYFFFSFLSSWVFVVAGVLLVLAGIFWLLAKADERRYYASRAEYQEELKARAQSKN